VLLSFSVKDTGIGIPAEKHPLLFQAFRQVDGSMTRAKGGTGLGLAISRQLTELMGGTIGVESEAGRGSCFHFTVRCQPCADEATPPARRFVQHLRLLVVETNPANAQNLSKYLTLWRLDPVFVATVEEAEEAWDRAAASGGSAPAMTM